MKFRQIESEDWTSDQTFRDQTMPLVLNTTLELIFWMIPTIETDLRMSGLSDRAESVWVDSGRAS
jgi:hypothetical protein